MLVDPNVLLEARRRDFHRMVTNTFPDFVDGWVYEDICDKLRKFMLDVRAKKSPRLIICLPPRMGKSLIGSVRFPLYCLLNNPTWEVMVATYGQSLSNRFSRFARNLLEAHPYIRSLWPDCKLADDHSAVAEWRLEKEGTPLFSNGGTYRAVGKGSAITGSGADCFVAGTGVTCYGYTRSIENLVPGEIVLSVCHDTGEAQWKKILAVRELVSEKTIIEIGTESGRRFLCTSDHRIFVGDSYKVAEECRLGEALCSHADAPQITRDSISSITRISLGKIKVYDIQVEENNNFFAEGILVHNCLICDDTIKDFKEADSPTVRGALWEWYSSTASTRVSPGGGILIIQTRWHPDDLVGRLLYEQKNTEGADKWDLVEYRALAEQDEKHRKQGESILPVRWAKEAFEKVRAKIIPRWWDALYQQRPINAGGVLFKEACFKRYYAAPAPTEFDMVVQSWDLRFGKSQAKSSSFVCGWVIGRKEGRFYILDEARGRWSYAESKLEVIKMAEKWPIAITKIVENKANGPALESDLEDQIPGILLYNPRGDKFQRAEFVLPLVLAGNVFIPEDAAQPWAKEALAELCAFPQGADDDRVDCLSMGLSYMIEYEQQTQVVTYL